MKTEIGKDFYCSTAGMMDCPNLGDYIVREIRCPDCHRKHPTPEQYKEEYGEEWTGAVYYRMPDLFLTWRACDFEFALTESRCPYKTEIVAACTPFGKPDEDWRPE